MGLKVDGGFCLILEFKEEKRTFAKVEGGNLNFFLLREVQTPPTELICSFRPQPLPATPYVPSSAQCGQF